jgi:hypothetical protein
MAYLAWIAPVLLLAGVGLVLLSRGRRTARGNRIVLLALGGSALVLIVLALLSLNGRFARRTPAAVAQPANCDTPPAQSPPAKPANASSSSRADFVTFASCGPGETPKPAAKGR